MRVSLPYLILVVANTREGSLLQTYASTNMILTSYSSVIARFFQVFDIRIIKVEHGYGLKYAHIFNLYFVTSSFLLIVF